MTSAQLKKELEISGVITAYQELVVDVRPKKNRNVCNESSLHREEYWRADSPYTTNKLRCCTYTFDMSIVALLNHGTSSPHP
jgi:hypothetical protein